MFQPKGPRVLVKRLDETKLSSSLIQVVQYNESPSQFAVVMAVGDGYMKKDGSREPLEVEVGDTVITKPYCGAPITVVFDGVEIEAFLLDAGDVLAKVSDVEV